MTKVHKNYLNCPLPLVFWVLSHKEVRERIVLLFIRSCLIVKQLLVFYLRINKHFMWKLQLKKTVALKHSSVTHSRKALRLKSADTDSRMNNSSAPLCDLRWIPSPFCTSLSPSVTWGNFSDCWIFFSSDNPCSRLSKPLLTEVFIGRSSEHKDNQRMF